MLMLPLSDRRVRTWLGRSLCIAALAAAGLATGLAPDLGTPRTPRFSTAALAQGISDDEVRRYAQALLDMEPQRVRAYNRLQDIVGNNIPSIVCNQTTSFSGLPGDARQIAANYCNHSRRIVRERGFSVQRFNQITEQIRSDERLRQRVQAAMRQLQ